MKNLARRAALAAAVPAVTALDAWRCRGRDTADLASDVTVCVKTFERPAVMARFVRSTRRIFSGLPVVAKAPQVYLARTASLRKVGWDEDLRMVDHRDFFSRSSGTLVFVTAPFPAYHSRTPWNRFFTEHRNDVEGDFSLLHRKWSDRAAAGAPVRPRPAPVGSLTSDL